MNYIWYPFIEALQSDFDTTKIRYRLCDRVFFDTLNGDTIRVSAGAHHISPLLEHIPLALYDPDHVVKEEDKFTHADVNPYIRFGSIFSHILSPERTDPNDLIVCDIITHMLAHIDRICGMSKRDFKLMLIIKEIENGCFGENNEVFALFNTVEKRAIAEILLMLYATSHSLRCLDALFRMIMTNFHLRMRDNTEIVFYTPYAFDEREDKKLRFIIKLFLPIDYPYTIHWRYTYGSIEHDESMILERFVL
ncbi:MAG: hypothetical protein FWG61_07885 [Firmicutes bacterium]|nr:hypothetical protein [Bacillota bacterium]